MPSHTKSERAKGSRSNIYGVFLVGGGWAMTRNKAEALREAKKRRGFVKVLKDDPSMSGGFDRPTFILTSTPVANGDFRNRPRRKGELNFRSPEAIVNQRGLDRA